MRMRGALNRKRRAYQRASLMMTAYCHRLSTHDDTSSRYTLRSMEGSEPHPWPHGRMGGVAGEASQRHCDAGGGGSESVSVPLLAAIRD